MTTSTATKTNRRVRIVTKPVEKLSKNFTGVRWAEDAISFEVWMAGKKVATTAAMNTAIYNLQCRLAGK